MSPIIPKSLLAFLLMVCLVSCGDMEKVDREIGYKGKARLNPWLAAEKFVQKYGYDVESRLSWEEPTWEQSVWLMPAASLSNRTFVHKMEEWMQEGGHLIVLIEHANPGNDWASDHHEKPILEKPLTDLFSQAGIHFDAHKGGAWKDVKFLGKTYEVAADSLGGVSADGGADGEALVSKTFGNGRLTVVTDGLMFRNRWISDHDHAALLLAMVQAQPDGGGVIGIMRGTGLSLWEMLGTHLWPLLVALAVLVVLALWRGFVRFGPVEPADPPSVLRRYDHHLEALGDYQWRLDKGAGLLAPIRAQIVERGQRLSARVGRRDDDFFQFLADRAGISRERVFRALAEAAPADTAILTRTTADLQRLLHVLT